MNLATFEATFTDTFGGELNYSWARRATFEAPENANAALLIRRAKRVLDVVGRHVKRWGGDEIRIDICGECTAVLISHLDN